MQMSFNKCIKQVLTVGFLIGFLKIYGQDSKLWITYEGKQGPGKGKNIVLISGDEEYRSEEALPMMAKILSQHHGFNCTVLFAIDSARTINPDVVNNIPGLHLLQTADLVIMSLRFRELPDSQMKYIDQYIHAGKPIVALRTSTHAFRYVKNKASMYAKYGIDSKVNGWEKGFGKTVLGETWVSHHGHHGVEGTRGIANSVWQNHPILKGVKDVYGASDVYTVGDLGKDVQILQYGISINGLTSSAVPNYEKSIMPIAWTKNYKTSSGKTCRIFATTMGAAVDLLSNGLRRMVVNASYWALNMEAKIDAESSVETIGAYNPTMFGFKNGVKGLRPIDFELK